MDKKGILLLPDATVEETDLFNRQVHIEFDAGVV
jgi:hypothetical protein